MIGDFKTFNLPKTYASRRKGHVYEWSSFTGGGYIGGDNDSGFYYFTRDDWKSEEQISRGVRVSFEVRDGRAVNIKLG